METAVYNSKGEKTGSVKLPESVFGLPWNADLVHQVMVSMMSNLRNPVAHTKGRGEVRGGGRKPWQQKGTGRARHGSIRSPIWRGGGVTGGPTKEKNFKRKINKKMKAKALFTLLSRKFKHGQVLFVDTLPLKAPKTKDAMAIVKSLSKIEGFSKLTTKRKNAALIAFAEKNGAGEKSFRNIGNIHSGEARNLNTLDLLKSTYLILENPKVSVEMLASRAEKENK